MKRSPRCFEITETSLIVRDHSRRMALRLDHLRKQHWMTQRELSRRTGVPQQTISDLETGWANPRISVLIQLAKYYDLTIGELFEPLHWD